MTDLDRRRMIPATTTCSCPPPADVQTLRQALADSLKQLDAARRAEETLPWEILRLKASG